MKFITKGSVGMTINKENVYIPAYIPRDILKGIAKEVIYINNYEKYKLYTINRLVSDIITEWCNNPILYEVENIKKITDKKKKIGITLKVETFHKLIKLYTSNYAGEISYRNDLILHILIEYLKKRASDSL